MAVVWAALVLTLTAWASALAQPLGRPDSDTEARRPALVDVPYVAQSADLCGGAALAMVRRYWGDTSTIAEDFADLVDPREGGITIGRLTEAAGSGAWTALPLAGRDPNEGLSMVASHLARGRPVIALILDRPGAFHYVVVVGMTATTVVLHDPARQPFETMTVDEFDLKWAAAGRWMLLVLPADAGSARTPEADTPGTVDNALPAAISAARDPIRRAIESASAGRLDAAEATLAEAARTHPDDPLVWRELAGVRFLERRWSQAEELALRAATLGADDPTTWRLVGASRYMRGDSLGALESFNRAGEPTIDRVLVRGSSSTTDPVVIASTGLRPGRLLTADDFARAARRLDAMPAVSQSSLRYEPSGGTTMTVQAAIAERPTLPAGWLGWMVAGARALMTETLVVDVASPARSGEVWHGAWRWADRWRRVAFGLQTPAMGAAPGIVTIEGLWERRHFLAARPGLIEQTRRRVGVQLSDWASGVLQWQAGIAFDRFDESGYFAVSGAIDRRWLDDRASLAVELEEWTGRSVRFGRATGVLALRSSAQEVPALSARAGVGVVTSGAPVSVWPTAGVGRDHLATLRAHPRLGEGLVSSTMMGRGAVFGSVELAKPLALVRTRQLWWASFVDAASIARPSSMVGRTVYLDAGVGLRVRVPAVDGTMSLDAAYGIGDGGLRLSAVVRRAWPGR